MPRADRGAVLLECVIALAILLAAGVSLVSLLGASLRSEAMLAARESEVGELDRLLVAMSLLTRADLDRRLGRHQIGPVLTDVQRPELALYRIAVGRPGMDPLVTIVYRPETEHP